MIVDVLNIDEIECEFPSSEKGKLEYELNRIVTMRFGDGWTLLHQSMDLTRIVLTWVKY